MMLLPLRQLDILIYVTIIYDFLMADLELHLDTVEIDSFSPRDGPFSSHAEDWVPVDSLETDSSLAYNLSTSYSADEKPLLFLLDQLCTRKNKYSGSANSVN